MHLGEIFFFPKQVSIPNFTFLRLRFCELYTLRVINCHILFLRQCIQEYVSCQWRPYRQESCVKMQRRALFSEGTSISIATPGGQTSVQFIKHGMLCVFWYPAVLQLLFRLSRDNTFLRTLPEKRTTVSLFLYEVEKPRLKRTARMCARACAHTLTHTLPFGHCKYKRIS